MTVAEKMKQSVFSTHSMQANNYNLRTEMYEGKEHLVVPVVMMVEGVHNGSHGPILHTIEELGKFAASWNGIPVPVLHPQEGGSFISANSPKVLQKQRVGWVFNTHVDGKKLKAEAWLEKDKLQKVSPITMAMIQNQLPMDVSVGVFTEDEISQGTWDGVEYKAIARNHRPDHLALLPGETGACSWTKGCGIRANSEGGEIVDVKDLDALRKLLAEEGLVIIQTNQDSAYGDVMEAIRMKLSALDTPLKSHYLVETYDKYFVFEIGTKPVLDDGIWSYSMYKMAYTVDDKGVVEFTGEPEEVIRKIEYVTMQKGGVKMERGKINTNETKPCCPEKVELLVNSQHSDFQETDREWLNSLTQEQIDKLVVPVANLEAEAQAKAELTAKTKEENETKDEKVPQMNKEEVIQVLRESMKTPEEFLSLLPADMKDQFASGLRLHKEQRDSLIEKLVAYSDAFTKEELAAKSMDELHKLEKLIPHQTDYSGLGAGGNIQANINKVTPLLPLGVVVTEKKEG